MVATIRDLQECEHWDRYFMNNFYRWLERRDPALFLPKSAKQFAAKQTDPVTLRAVEKDMEAEADWLRKRLGMKKDRPKTRRGL